MTVGTLRGTGRSLSDVFRNPGLRRVQLAFAGSVIGDWAFMVAVSVYAYAAGGAAAVGLLAVVRYTVASLVLPFTSMLVDRMPRKRVMIGSDLLRAVVVGGAAAVIGSDGPDLLVYALLVVATVCGTPFRPAQAAILPGLARDPGELTAANATASTVESVGFFAGPALGGLLLEFTDVEVVVVFNAITFLFSAALVAGVRERPATTAGSKPLSEDGEHEESEQPGFLAEAAAGFRTIGADRDLRLLVALFALQCAVAGASAVYIVSIGLELLEIGPSGVGYLDGITGVGGFLGGFVALSLARRNRLALDFGGGVLLWGAPLLLIAAWPALAPAAIAFALVGLGNSVVDINASTILQRLVPGHVLGRVFGAVDSLLIAAMALGALVTPLLFHLIGIRGALAVLGCVVTAGVAVGIPGLLRIDARILPPPHTDLLRRVPIFAPLPEATVERLAYALHDVRFAAGDVVFRDGEPGDRYYVIVSGEVEILGRTFGPGEGFGEIALLRDVPRTATVTALSDVELVALERDDFIGAVSGHSSSLAAADAMIAARLRG
jgi:MFS family permease